MRQGNLSRLGFGVALAGMAGLLLSTGNAQAEEPVVWHTQGVSKTEIVLGMHTDLSGVAATFGVGTANAFRLRIDEVNAKGGINGRKIRLVVEDTQYQVPKAVQAVNKLLNRDKVFAIVGGLGTPMNMAVMKQQFAAGVPNLFPITAARQMYEPLHPLKFAGFAPYYDQMRTAVAWFVKKQDKKRVCIMYQDTDFGREVLAGVVDQLKALNLPLVASGTHKPIDTDFTAELTKLHDANCDLVAMGSIVRDSILPYAASRKMGWNVDMVGSSAAYDFAVSGAQGGATEGYYAMGLVKPPYRDGASAPVLAFLDSYKAKFGSDPSIASVYGYDVMDLVIFALDKAGPDLTTKALVKGLESIDGYRDMFGGAPLSFSSTKHIGSLSSMVFRVHDGKWVQQTQPTDYEAM